MQKLVRRIRRPFERLMIKREVKKIVGWFGWVKLKHASRYYKQTHSAYLAELDKAHRLNKPLPIWHHPTD